MLFPRLLIIFTVSLVSSALYAYTQTLTSSKRHARHYAYVADHGFDPHYYINKAETASMLILFCRCFWEIEVQNIETGFPQEKALEKCPLKQKKNLPVNGMNPIVTPRVKI